MKKLFKPACLLFNILILILFFFVGLLYAGWMDVGKNQGLAGGAIVLSYGVIFSFVALILSFFITYHLQHKRIVWGNIIMTLLIVICFLFLKYNADKRREGRESMDQEKMTQPAQPINRVHFFAQLEIPKHFLSKTNG